MGNPWVESPQGTHTRMEKDELKAIREVLAAYDVEVKRTDKMQALVDTSRADEHEINEVLQEAGYWTVVSDEWVHIYFEGRT